MILSDKISFYEKAQDYILTPDIPIVAKVNIKNYSKITKNLKKPYSLEFISILSNAMFMSVVDIEGVIFGYQHFGEFNFILRNKNDICYGNKVQKINSNITCLMTMNFLKNYYASSDPPDLLGEALFECSVFLIPTVEDTADYIISKQKECFGSSISIIAESELSKVFEEDTLNILKNKTVDQKLDLLLNETDFDFANIANEFRYGVGVYKIPKIIKDTTKNKWNINKNMPDMSHDDNFIINIIKSGHDVFRS